MTLQRLDLSWHDVGVLAELVMEKLLEFNRELLNIHPVPNGGIPAALAVVAKAARRGSDFRIVSSVNEAHVFLDDIVDSGRTMTRMFQKRCLKFYALIDKRQYPKFLADRMAAKETWISFPWEQMKKEEGPEDNIRRLLQFIGEDPDREGLKETPSRVVRSYAELFSGYKQDPKEVIKTFEDGTCDEMVVLRDVEFYSVCEHHMMPFMGKAHIAYIPNGKILGLSKLARLLEVYARRLQVQERLTQQVTAALDTHLAPKGSACVLEATHLCMTCRGVQKQHSRMVTSSLTGVFRQSEVRQEFFNLIRG